MLGSIGFLLDKWKTLIFANVIGQLMIVNVIQFDFILNIATKECILT